MRPKQTCAHVPPTGSQTAFQITGPQDGYLQIENAIRTILSLRRVPQQVRTRGAGAGLDPPSEVVYYDELFRTTRLYLLASFPRSA
jgi:hypothetical protein